MIQFFGITSYSMENTGLVFHIRSSMKRPTKFNGYLLKSMLMMCTFTIFLAYLAYMVPKKV